MTEKEEQKKEIKKYLIISIVLVVSIAIIGMSLSYAYFAINFMNPTDGKTVPDNKAAKLNVTSDVNDAEAISTKNLALIEASDVDKEAETVKFTVTNNEDSIPADYDINLVDLELSKNLLSQYFKWKVVVTHGDETAGTTQNGTFQDSNCANLDDTVKSEDGNGECHYVLTNADGEYTPTDADMMVYNGSGYIQKTDGNVKNSTLTLATIENFAVGKTDTIKFYIWLENDPKVDQLYLTNGSFSGKLSIVAVPHKTE